MVRMVQCVKIGRELPGLDRLPFAGELGQRIYDQVSKEAWGLWPAQATVIINHYGMSMADPRAQQILMQQMEEFFFGEGAQLPEGWAPEQQRSKGGPQRK
jgi:Fe-S cluster biosynthesis and repair protein YggX